MGKRNRTLHYKRVAWDCRIAPTLQEILIRAHKLRHETSKRAFPDSGGGEISGLYFNDTGNTGFFGQIVKYDPDGPVSLVPKPDEKTMARTSERLPPRGSDYMDSDLFYLVLDDHLVICQSAGMRLGSFKRYCIAMMEGTSFEPLAPSLEITGVANPDTMKTLKAEGVKKILLNGTTYSETLRQVKMGVEQDHSKRQSVFFNLMGKTIAEVEKILGERSTELQEKEIENLKVHLSITYDARTKSGEVSGEAMEQIGRSLAESKDDNEFTIITESGNRVTPNSLIMMRTIDVEPSGNSVSVSDVQTQMVTYMRELQSFGRLET